MSEGIDKQQERKKRESAREDEKKILVKYSSRSIYQCNCTFLQLFSFSFSSLAIFFLSSSLFFPIRSVSHCDSDHHENQRIFFLFFFSCVWERDRERKRETHRQRRGEKKRPEKVINENEDKEEIVRHTVRSFVRYSKHISAIRG